MRGAQQKKSKRLKRKSLVKPTPPGSRPLEKIINQWARKIKDFQDGSPRWHLGGLPPGYRWPKCCQPSSSERRRRRRRRWQVDEAQVNLCGKDDQVEALGAADGARRLDRPRRLARRVEPEGSSHSVAREWDDKRTARHSHLHTHSRTTPAPPPARETIRGARIFDL